MKSEIATLVPLADFRDTSMHTEVRVLSIQQTGNISHGWHFGKTKSMLTPTIGERTDPGSKRHNFAAATEDGLSSG